MNTQYGRLVITPAVQLILVFSIWKVGLLLLAALTPGPGYDTSGLILFINDGNRHVQYQSLSVIERLTLKLFRWDALYFVKAAQRGYEYEQEWAFSATYSSILRVISNYIFGHDESLKHYIWTGLLVSNLSHLLSVLILYRLLRLVLPAHQNGHIPLIAAVLHVLSPASLFLSAPYTESLFSLLNFIGMLLYVLARQAGETTTWTVRADAYMLSSGLIFAAATLTRSNGLLSGLIFLYDMTCLLPDILAFRLGWHEIRRAFVTCVSGSMIAAGYISPQLVAYQSFCVVGASNPNSRPWCSAVIPSIYSWVQNYYWNVGFLRYWTISNLPLFLLAAPMLWLLCHSSVTVMHALLHRPTIVAQSNRTSGSGVPCDSSVCHYPQLALPQFVLAVAAATTFHIQIVNRLCSGYPIWYLVVAFWTTKRISVNGKVESNGVIQYAVRGLIMYSMVQGMLFASFLPPA